MGMTKTGSSALGEMLTSSKVGGFLPKASLFLDPNPSRFRVGLPTNFLTSTGQVNFPTSNTVINVNYTGFTPAAQTAFQFAVDIWESLLDSSVPINVNASFANLGSGILGQAGPESFFRNFSAAPQTNTWYPVALANSLAGQDLDPAASDIGSQFNSNFNWYYGLDNNVPTNQISFVSVVLHELGHGLGFLGLMNNQSGVGSWGFGTGSPGIYDRFTENGSGQSLLNTSLFPNPSTALGSQLTSNNIFFDGSNANAANGGNRVKLYAPSTWSGGSSYSHLDEVFNNTPNALMTYSIGFGESILNPGPVTLGLFKDMGWKLAGPSTKSISIAKTTDGKEAGPVSSVFTLTRTGDLSSALTVNYTLAGTATPGVDYTNPGAGKATFLAGSSKATITLPTKDDLLSDPNETIITKITAPAGYTISGADTATATILDNDSTGNTFTNSDPISIDDESIGGTNPYPSSISVSGLSGNISNLKVTLNNVSHTWIGDVDILLVGPTGSKSILMSDIGEALPVSGVNLTFDTSATTLIDDSNVGTSGSYKPNDIDSGDGDFFDSPAPVGPYKADLSVFNNTSGNGTWSLYAFDDFQFVDVGEIADGWSLTIDTASTKTISIAKTTDGKEAGSVSSIFTLTRTGDLSSALTVNYTLAGTATPGVDYTNPGAGKATFAAGSSKATITLPTKDDLFSDPGETIITTITAPVGYTISGPNNPTSTILDNDGNSGNNNLVGTSFADALAGVGGNDTINGGLGNDTIDGGAGNDSLTGGLGKDTLTGSTGLDTLNYNSLGESLLSGFDVIQGYSGTGASLDRINAPGSIAAITLTASKGTATSLTEAAIQLVLTNAAFAANTAAAFKVTGQSGTFIALNNGAAGFQAASDAIIQLSGYNIAVATPVVVI
jgi:hypothetical protein